MCFNDDGDYAELSEVSFVRTRKHHHCEECGRRIQAGELAEHQRGKYDGAFFSYHLCGECEATRKAIADHEIEEGCRGSETWCPLGELVEYCRETGFARATFEAGQNYLRELREQTTKRKELTK